MTTLQRAPQPPVSPTRRPVGVAIAAALLGVVALAGAIFGPYLVVLGTVVANRLPAEERSLVVAIETLLGLGCLVLSVVSVLTARGLVRAASWAWPAALSVGLTLTVATAVLFVEGPWLTAYALIGALGVGMVVTLLPRSVRRAFAM